MSFRTLAALAAFVVLTASLMLDKDKMTLPSADLEPQSTRYDLSLSSGNLVFSEPLPEQGDLYLISPADLQAFNSHSTRVILDTLDALPEFSASMLAAHEDGAQSKSVNQ